MKKKPDWLGLKIYNGILGGAFPLFLIYYAGSRLFRHKYRQSALYRLGLKMPSVEFSTGADPVWIHALSVGETMASVPLVEAIGKEISCSEIIFSTATEAGQETARSKLAGKVSQIFYLPHDFSWCVERLVSGIRPKLFIVVETDAWPNLLFYLNKYNVPTFLVNGRMSPKSFRGYRRIRGLSKLLFEGFDMCLMQSSEDVRKLLDLGVARDKVKNTGNLKFDVSPSVSERERKELAAGLSVGPGVKVLVAGSTHRGEEEIIVTVFSDLLKESPQWRLLLVPRHPGRGAEITNIVAQKDMKSELRSQGGSLKSAHVVIVDTMGELARLYSLASLAIIGGSFVPVGGHNPLEPLSFGVPVIFGPHMFNFREIERELLKSKCAIKVPNKSGLRAALRKLAHNSGFIKEMAGNAGRVIRANRGTTERVMTYLLPYLRGTDDN